MTSRNSLGMARAMRSSKDQRGCGGRVEVVFWVSGFWGFRVSGFWGFRVSGFWV